MSDLKQLASAASSRVADFGLQLLQLHLLGNLVLAGVPIDLSGHILVVFHGLRLPGPDLLLVSGHCSPLLAVHHHRVEDLGAVE